MPSLSPAQLAHHVWSQADDSHLGEWTHSQIIDLIIEAIKLDRSPVNPQPGEVWLCQFYDKEPTLWLVVDEDETEDHDGGRRFIHLAPEGNGRIVSIHDTDIKLIKRTLNTASFRHEDPSLDI